MIVATKSSSKVVIAVAILVFVSEIASAASAIATNYLSYSDIGNGTNTFSPFAATFGALSQQDPNPVSETTSVYDFRGLGESALAGETYFFLEDWQDGQLDMPGVTVNGLPSVHSTRYAAT